MVSARPLRYEGVSGTSRRASRDGGAFCGIDGRLTERSAPACSSIASLPGSIGRVCGGGGGAGPFASESFDCRASSLGGG